VLLDLSLPKIGGLEVLQQLKADPRTRKIPVVVLSSSTQDKDILRTYDLGVNSYVSKPVHFEDFAHVVTQMGLYWMLINKPPIES
jgi:CheY-like chemotaxis protein